MSKVDNQKDVTHTGICLCVQTTYRKVWWKQVVLSCDPMSHLLGEDPLVFINNLRDSAIQSEEIIFILREWQH